MKNSDYQYQLLVERATTLYKSEKELSGIFDALKINTEDENLKQGITIEAEENKKHCERLEGLLEVLTKMPFRPGTHDDPAKQNFIQQFSTMLKRIAFKHAAFGYKTAIFVALALGQNEIATFLRCSLSHGNILFIK